MELVENFVTRPGFYKTINSDLDQEVQSLKCIIRIPNTEIRTYTSCYSII